MLASAFSAYGGGSDDKTNTTSC